jgi:DNA-binding response OmpR family regulator
MKALIVEDEEEVVESIRLCLLIRWPHCVVIAAHTSARGLEAVRQEDPDLVLLDILLPDRSGLDTLEQIRRVSAVPVVIVSAQGDQASRARGLELGADDYLAKPFAHAELLARIHAVLRRVRAPDRAVQRPLRGPGLTVDLPSGRVTVDGSERQLSDIECRLLSYLARNEGRIMALDLVARNVWGGTFVEEAAVRMCVHRLRLKLGDDPRAPRIVVSHRGRGYSLDLHR